MAWVRRKAAKKTYYSIGRTVCDSESRVFRDVRLPDGDMMRVMDKGVHEAALESAGRKFQELARKSGKKEPSGEHSAA